MNIGYDGYFISDDKGAWGKLQRILLQELTKMANNMTFFVFTDTEGEKLLPSSPKIKIVKIEKSKDNFISRTRSIKKAVVANDLKLDAYIETVEIAPKIDKNIKLFTIIHDFSQGRLEPPLSLDRIKGIVYSYYRKSTMERSARIFFNSKSTMNNSPILKRNPIKIVNHHGVDEIFSNDAEGDVEFLAKSGLNKYEYFLFVGRVTVPYKNFNLLLRAFKLFIESNNGIKLAVATTEIPTKKDMKTIRELKNNIVILRGLESAKLVTLYKFAIAFIFPSSYEGFGVPILEAQRIKCPLILNDIPVFREVSGGCAMFFDGTEEGLLKRMVEIQGKEARESLVECGYSNSLKYSWERTAEIIYNHLEEVEAHDRRKA